MEKILTTIPITIEIKEEMELRKLRNVTVKTGLPQGFSISPLLSILVIDAAFKAIGEDPVLYADDGIIMKKEKTDLTLDQIDMLSRWGLQLSSKLKKDGTPGCKWIEDEFTFLGIKHSLSRDAFYVEMETGKYKWISSNKMTDNMYWEELETYNGPSNWEWDIDPNCIALQNKSITSQSNWKLLMRWVEGSPMVKRCGLIFLDIQKESSFSTRKLLTNEKRRTRDNSVKRVKMLDKYLVPLLRTHTPPSSLPSLGTEYQPYKYQTEIRNPLSMWLKMDELKRKLLYKALYSHTALYEYHTSSWRDKEYADWEPNHITTMIDAFEMEEEMEFERRRKLHLPVQLTDPAIPKVSFFDQWYPLTTEAACQYTSRWDRMHMYKLIKVFVSSFFITYFWMVGTDPGYISQAIIWHIKNLIKPDWNNSWNLPSPSLEIPEGTNDWIGYFLLAILMLLLGGLIVWYFGHNPNPRPPKLLSDECLPLRESSQDLDRQVLEISEIRTVITESPYLPDTSKIEVLRMKLQSVMDTLLVVRRENISLTNQLYTQTKELLYTNSYLDKTQAELAVALDRLNRLCESSSSQEHSVNFLADNLLLVLECPAFKMLHELNEITNWDSNAISILQAASMLEVDPSTGDASRESLINVITLIRDFISEHPILEDIASMTSNV